jgi:hypothetical protein
MDKNSWAVVYLGSVPKVDMAYAVFKNGYYQFQSNWADCRDYVLKYGMDNDMIMLSKVCMTVGELRQSWLSKNGI